ncbi:Hypothetical predicted protein [Olea europaea subsp. europaea]|uniref:Uncharacterized protein n=1 Tax=Olea europaea subsp. europaea TaxID=158383 RepID=A0A8S0UB71_OLEEU|nr:Hypothetical predicted protein [Olea europaea subsp. europaea]
MDHISEKAKEEVQKILSSKHLHYEEMCSYHNGNRLHLPPDPDLQSSLRLALRSGDDHDENDVNRHLHDDNVEVGQEAESDGNDEYEENQPEIPDADVTQAPPEGVKANTSQKQLLNHHTLQLEEQRLHIEAQMLELEKERVNWQRFARKRTENWR